MAVGLPAHEISDLCLGKPALRCLPAAATVGDALAALRRYGDAAVGLWGCGDLLLPPPPGGGAGGGRACVGKVCAVDIVCFLCREENLADPAAALRSKVEAVVPKAGGLVRHLEPHASLLDAIELILEGAQNLVVPMRSPGGTKSRNNLLHNHREYCWLTQEDIIRYLLNFINLFAPIPALPINSLGIIDTDSILAVHYYDPAASALRLIPESNLKQTAVAIVDDEDQLIGEISPLTLSSCDLTVAAAVLTLSAGDLMAYIDCGGPPDDLVRLVKERLEEKNLVTFLESLEEELAFSLPSASSSSDEEFGCGKGGRVGGYSARMVRRSEAIMCYPSSSLVAVMIQALAHRVSYVWVVEEDGSLAGIVTFKSMLRVFHERLKSMS
ncbi:CBS domain-containing protein CBSX5-like [Syzygium oleosum]|uniref:CBS domain-containing protein CBSX5-like n=1 Tax=Syzygium oleosum TaxID=219896 RepID=UPI0024BA159A|nr:CBS domain-containing protein CBSX5-like [Syzygium oleosum]